MSVVGCAWRGALPSAPDPALELTAGNLSQHLGVLEKAGLVTIEKGYAGKRAPTWITLTATGRTALRDEVNQLKVLVDQIESHRR